MNCLYSKNHSTFIIRMLISHSEKEDSTFFNVISYRYRRINLSFSNVKSTLLKVELPIYFFRIKLI